MPISFKIISVASPGMLEARKSLSTQINGTAEFGMFLIIGCDGLYSGEQQQIIESEVSKSFGASWNILLLKWKASSDGAN